MTGEPRSDSRATPRVGRHFRLLSAAGTIAALFVATTVGYSAWLHRAANPILVEAQAQAIAYADGLLAAGPTPESWDTRVFLPSSTVRALGEALSGSTYVSHVGPIDADGRFDGAIVVRLDAMSIDAVDRDGLHPRMTLSVRYAADRASPWWAGAAATLDVDAVLSPVAGGLLGAPALRMVPVSVTPTGSWNPFAVRTNKLVAETLARQVVQIFSGKLLLPIPPLKAPFELSMRIDSSQHSNFGVEGGYDLVTKLDGPKLTEEVAVAYPLVTGTGIWLLGGRTPSFPAARLLPTDRREAALELGRWRSALALRYHPFEIRAEDVEIRLPNRPVVEMVDQISGPPSAPKAYAISLGTANAQGVIAKATALKDDILGEVGVSITPQHPAFLSGSATASLTDPRWIAGVGMQSTVKASIKATAAIHYHVSSGPFGGGKGGDTTIEGSTSGTLPVKLKIALERTDAGDAIVLLPEIGCSRIRIDAYSQAALVNFGWIKIGKLGVRITRSVGGGRQTPTPLVTSLPQIYAIRSENARGAVEELHLAHPALAASWNLKSAEVEETGIRVVAGLTVASSDAKPGAVSMEAQTRLREALASAAPTTTCEGGQELAALVDQAEIGSSNEIVKIVDATVKAGVRVAQQTMDQVEKLRTKPIETIGKAPANIAREAEKAGQWLGDRTGIRF